MKKSLLLMVMLIIFQQVLFADNSKKADNVPSAESTEQTQKLRVLQFNVWNEGKSVEGGEEGIIKTLEEINPDVVLFQEIRGQKFIDQIIDYFKDKGITYYGRSMNISTAFLSKYPIKSIRSSDELGEKSYAFVKAAVDIANQEFIFYSIHLHWKYLAFYDLRGFDGNSDTRPYKQLEPALEGAKNILAVNNLSRRPLEVRTIIDDAQKEIEKGKIVILGGDFNEPSFMDWQKGTQKIRDHRDHIINWPCSSMLYKAGFVDCYRSMYPNPVTHPGFTCNAGNPKALKRHLCWAYGVDDRERIDLNFYYPNKKIKLTDAIVVGPREDFYDNKIQLDKTKDNIYTPKCLWPSDHKAVLSVYELETESR